MKNKNNHIYVLNYILKLISNIDFYILRLEKRKYIEPDYEGAINEINHIIRRISVLLSELILFIVSNLDNNASFDLLDALINYKNKLNVYGYHENVFYNAIYLNINFFFYFIYSNIEDISSVKTKIKDYINYDDGCFSYKKILRRNIANHGADLTTYLNLLMFINEFNKVNKSIPYKLNSEADIIETGIYYYLAIYLNRNYISVDSSKDMLETSPLNENEVKKVYTKLYKECFNGNSFIPNKIIKDISLFSLGEELYKDPSRIDNLNEVKKYLKRKI